MLYRQGRTLEKNQRDRENRAKAAAKHVVDEATRKFDRMDDGGARSSRNRH